MLDRNDLQLLGNLLDEKLVPIRADIAELKSDVSTLKSDVSTLKSDVSTLKSDVSVLKSDVSVLKSDVSVLKSDISELKVRVGVLEKDVSGLKQDVAGLRVEMHQMEKRLTEKIDKNYNDLLNFFGQQKERNAVHDDEVVQLKRRMTALEEHVRRCKCYYCRFHSETAA